MMTITQTRQLEPRAALAWAVGASVLAGAAMGLGVYAYALRVADSGSAVAALAGVAVAWSGGIAGSVLSVGALGRAPLAQAHGALAGLATRFGVTLLGALAIATLAVVALRPFLLAVGGAHLIFLAVDVAMLIWLRRRVTGEAA